MPLNTRVDTRGLYELAGMPSVSQSIRQRKAEKLQELSIRTDIEAKQQAMRSEQELASLSQAAMQGNKGALNMLIARDPVRGGNLQTILQQQETARIYQETAGQSGMQQQAPALQGTQPAARPVAQGQQQPRAKVQGPFDKERQMISQFDQQIQQLQMVAQRQAQAGNSAGVAQANQQLASLTSQRTTMQNSITSRMEQMRLERKANFEEKAANDAATAERQLQKARKFDVDPNATPQQKLWARDILAANDEYLSRQKLKKELEGKETLTPTQAADLRRKEQLSVEADQEQVNKALGSFVPMEKSVSGEIKGLDIPKANTSHLRRTLMDQAEKYQLDATELTAFLSANYTNVNTGGWGGKNLTIPNLYLDLMEADGVSREEAINVYSTMIDEASKFGAVSPKLKEELSEKYKYLQEERIDWLTR